MWIKMLGRRHGIRVPKVATFVSAQPNFDEPTDSEEMRLVEQMRAYLSRTGRRFGIPWLINCEGSDQMVQS